MLVAIDGVAMEDRSMHDVAARLLGAPGSLVMVRFRRQARFARTHARARTRPTHARARARTPHALTHSHSHRMTLAVDRPSPDRSRSLAVKGQGGPGVGRAAVEQGLRWTTRSTRARHSSAPVKWGGGQVSNVYVENAFAARPAVSVQCV